LGIEKGRISSRQTTYLVVNTILATSILFLPALMAEEVGQDAWVSILIAAVLGYLIGSILVISLGFRFPGKNFVEYAIELVGPWGGRILGFLWSGFYLVVNGIVVREFGELLTTEVMPETPLTVFIAMILSMAVFGVYLGLEVFARVNEIVFPLFLGVLLFLLVVALPQMDFRFLQPAFQHRFSELLVSAANLLAFYGEGVVLAMFLPYVRHLEEAKRIRYEITIILNLTILLVIVGVLAHFGPDEVARLVFPTFELAKAVRAGFVERIESLVVGIWITSVGVKVMVFYYVTVLALAQTLGLKDYRPLVFPCGLILAVLAVLQFEDTNHLRAFLAHYWIPFGLTFQWFIPFFLYLVAVFRKKGDLRGG
jgi:spore germination protein KB